MRSPRIRATSAKRRETIWTSSLVAISCDGRTVPVRRFKKPVPSAGAKPKCMMKDWSVADGAAGIPPRTVTASAAWVVPDLLRHVPGLAVDVVGAVLGSAGADAVPAVQSRRPTTRWSCADLTSPSWRG
jgi:hypothetical protein